MDWPDGGSRGDFLGFAVARSPGFRGEGESWLPNRIGFDGPRTDGADIPSNVAPIQKFLWWDARIDDADRGSQFTYEVTRVGTPGQVNRVYFLASTLSMSRTVMRRVPRSSLK